MPGCQVRRLQSESVIDSRRLWPWPSGKLELVGLAKTLVLFENVEAVEDGRGLMYGWVYAPPALGPWKGLAPDGTERRRPGVLDPHVGDWTPDENLGLPVPVENVADVGVLMPVGDWLPAPLPYVETMGPGSPMRGGL